MDLDVRSPVFWRGHLVGHFLYIDDIAPPGMPPDEAWTRGPFKALDCEVSKEFMRLLQSPEGVPVGRTPNLWTTYSFLKHTYSAKLGPSDGTEDGWLEIRMGSNWPQRRPEPMNDQTEAALLDKLDEHIELDARADREAIRQDILDAIAKGQSNCAYDLCRALVGHFRAEHTLEKLVNLTPFDEGDF